MYVVKRDGQREPVAFDKITLRIRRLCEQEPALPVEVDPTIVCQKVVQGVYSGVKTTELDNLAAETAAYMSTTHPGYGELAARIAVSNLHKETPESFYEVIEMEYKYVSERNGLLAPLVSDELFGLVQKYKEQLEKAIDFRRDFNYDFFGFKTLERSYLVKLSGRIVERPQHMLMRVSLGVHGDDLESVLKTYDYLSNGWFIHATPTLFNAGTPKPQMSSCFLLAMKDDSIEGIYETLKQTALISKSAGGIGVSIHNIRASRSYIKGTNGTSNGLIPMLRVYNDTARYVDQCFVGETIVYTEKGPRPIQDLQIGERVFTSTGQYQTVTRVLAHQVKDETLLAIGTQHSIQPVRVTEAHQFLVLRGDRQALSLNHSTMHTRLDRGYIRAEMVNATDLEVGDFVCYPTPSDGAILDVEDLSADDCRFYGILVGNGCIPPNNDTNGPHTCYITLAYQQDSFGTNNTSVIDFVRAYMRERSVHITDVIRKDEHCIRLCWNGNVSGFKFARGQLYDEKTKDKKIDQMFINLPAHKLLAIVQGLIETSSSVGRNVQLRGMLDQNNSGAEIMLELPSPTAVETVRYMLMRCGILTSGYKNHHLVGHGQDIAPQNETSTVLCIPHVRALTDRIPVATQGQHTNYFLHDGILYTRIVSIKSEPTKYSGVLYDLEVDVDHTYVTHAGVVHNGGGKRKGAFAMYLEPWHADVMDFLQLKKNHGKEEQRARDLFYALWIPDLFMKRVEANEDWSLFCPAEAPGLHECWGEAFEELYMKYEKEGRARTTVKAQDLWFDIIDSQIETGTPYMLYKDACNRKSNQQNLGTIKSSNLCTEIIEYTSSDEVAVCNLASLALPKYVRANGTFDHEKLYEVVYHVTGNLNSVIDRNYYPVPEAHRSNMRHRPIGLGVQGLADVFLKMRFPFESAQAAETNKAIFETIYFAALSRSKDLAMTQGHYETFPGSPASKGFLQFDMWGVTPSSRWDWTTLKADIIKHGLRNSLLIAPMPTASTSQILGNNECFEPYTTNIYTRRVLAGEFCILNQHLLRDLMGLGLWTDDIKNQIIAQGGSVQGIPEIPDHLKELYKTVWEIKQRTLIDMAADRGAFIDQSQSFNAFMAQPTAAKLTSMHFYSWKKGLKTGMYYLRTRPAADAIKFTVDQQKLRARTDSPQPAASTNAAKSSPTRSTATTTNTPAQQQDTDGEICRMEEGCLVCGS